MEAARNGHEDFVRLLIENKAVVNAPDQVLRELEDLAKPSDIFSIRTQYLQVYFLISQYIPCLSPDLIRCSKTPESMTPTHSLGSAFLSH